MLNFVSWKQNHAEMPRKQKRSSYEFKTAICKALWKLKSSVCRLQGSLCCTNSSKDLAFANLESSCSGSDFIAEVGMTTGELGWLTVNPRPGDCGSRGGVPGAPISLQSFSKALAFAASSWLSSGCKGGVLGAAVSVDLGFLGGVAGATNKASGEIPSFSITCKGSSGCCSLPSLSASRDGVRGGWSVCGWPSSSVSELSLIWWDHKIPF